MSKADCDHAPGKKKGKQNIHILGKLSYSQSTVY